MNYQTVIPDLNQCNAQTQTIGPAQRMFWVDPPPPPPPPPWGKRFDIVKIVDSSWVFSTKWSDTFRSFFAYGKEQE